MMRRLKIILLLIIFIIEPSIVFTYSEDAVSEEAIKQDNISEQVSDVSEILVSHKVPDAEPIKKKFIALTFDDGPSKYTWEVLDILDKYNIKATFFVVGEMVKYNPKTFQEIISRGHQIGNHTYDHKWLTKLDTSDIKLEIDKCNSIIGKYYDKRVEFIRPPYLASNKAIKTIVQNKGMVLVFGIGGNDVNTKDSPKVIVNQIINALGNSTRQVIILHDGVTKREKLITLLPILIDKLTNMGYNFITLDDFYNLK